MCWRAALCAIGVGVAALGFCIHGTFAQDADDSDDDDAELIEAKQPAWHRYIDPILSTKPGLDFLTGGMPDRLIYFTGFDVWRYGVGGYAGFQWAPNGIYQDGFILRAAISDNFDRFTTRTHRYINDIARGSLMAGLKFSGYRAEIQLLAGFEGQADFQLDNGRLQDRARGSGRASPPTSGGSRRPC